MVTARSRQFNRLSIIDRAILVESVKSFLAVFAVLCLIIMGQMFVSLLGDVVDGEFPESILLPLVGLSLLRFGVQLMPLALMLGLMLAFGRMYRDSEMVAIRACGIGYSRIYRVLALLVVPVFALLALLAFFVSPLSVQIAERLIFQAEHRPDIDAVGQGRFMEASDGDWVIFTQRRIRGTGTLEGVFVHTREHGKVVIETARTARQYTDMETGERMVELSDGHRYEGAPGEANYRIISFEAHQVRVPPLQGGGFFDTRESVPSRVLMRSDKPTYQAEFQWRVSIPLSAVLLALLALPLSHSSPRQGRYGKVGMAIVIYVLYSNLTLFAVSLITSEKVPQWIGVWWVHALLAGLVVVLLARQYGWHWLLRRSPLGAVTS